MLYKIVTRNLNCNTWNGRTTQKPNAEVVNLSKAQIKKIFGDKDPDSKSFRYDYGDGWTDEVSVVKITAKEANQIRKGENATNQWFKSMILEYGKLLSKQEQKELGV